MFKFDKANAIAPKEVFKKQLEVKGLTVESFADISGKDVSFVNDLYNGNVMYNNEDIATLLESVLSVPKQFWISLENNYQIIANETD